MKVLIAIAQATGTILFLTTQIMADDYILPPWRGGWCTTTQWWEFADDTLFPNPDGPGPLVPGTPGDPYQPGYLPHTAAIVNHFGLGYWIDTATDGSGREGIWSIPSSGHIEISVVNHEPPNPHKWMWVQLTWKDQDGYPPVTDPLSLLTGFYGYGPGGSYEPGYYVHDTPVVLEDPVDAFGWHTTTYEWFIYPNPVSEMFNISGTILVDQVVIDTWCVPEPNATILLVVGALGILFIRKRSTNSKLECQRECPGVSPDPYL